MTIVLLPATVAYLVALQFDPNAFGRLIGSTVPQGWPEFPESIEFTLDRLRDHPNEADWWMHVLRRRRRVGRLRRVRRPPQDGVVEIGYELAPAFRGKGLGRPRPRSRREGTRTGTVTMVIANTLAHDNPSTRVLRHLGIGWTRELVDPEDGPIWRWELPLTAC